MRSPHIRLGCKAAPAKTALAPALLAVTGMTLLPSAQAQKLDLGQNGSTTVGGTAILTDAGTTASGTYTYDDGGTGTLLSQQTNFNTLDTYGPSTANVSDESGIGVSIVGLNTYDTSTATVSGGSIIHLQTFDSSTATFSGGSISGELFTYDTSLADVSGGNLYGLVTRDTSTANISGGNISNLNASDSSLATVRGGNIGSLVTYATATAAVSGGSISNLATYDNSIIDLFGTDLNENLLTVNPDDHYMVYNVTGTLRDGTLIDADYTDFGGKLLFNPVPEASSVVSLGLLLALGLGGLMVNARRKAAAAP